MSLLTRPFLRREFRVAGFSMAPTFAPHATVLSTPFVFGLPRRGDVVILRSLENQDRTDIKRIVGLPGETISSCGTHVSINGELLEEPYAQKSPSFAGPVRTWVLARGEYFVAGDNRICSRDSRAYGPVPESFILGRVITR